MTSLFTYFKSAPPFDLWQSHPGKQSKVLITAGVDGDEYAGIAAAKTLIKTYQGATPIIIIPIVNLPGYHTKTSLNPLDGRYPKYLYPGSPYGSSSSRLRYSLSKQTKYVDLWIDLHGGATDEHLIPFIWAPAKYSFLSYLSGRILVEDSIKKNVPYVILESGELGQVKKSAINQHLSWINAILKNIAKPAKPNWTPTFTKVKYEKFSNQPSISNTLWYSPSVFVSAN